MDQTSILILRFLLASLHVLPFLCAWKAFDSAKRAGRPAEAEATPPPAWRGWLAATTWGALGALFAWGALAAGSPFFAANPSPEQNATLLTEKRGDVELRWMATEGFQRSAGFHLRRADGKEAYVHFATDQLGYWLCASASEDAETKIVRYRVCSANPKLSMVAEWDVAAGVFKVGDQSATLETLFAQSDQE
jgi:hypothetical protein